MVLLKSMFSRSAYNWSLTLQRLNKCEIIFITHLLNESQYLDYNDFYYELGSFEVEDETFQLEKTKLTIKNYYYNSDTRIKNNTDDDSNLWGGLLQEFSYGDLEFDLEIIDYEAAIGNTINIGLNALVELNDSK